jgi:hypothetical protein
MGRARTGAAIVGLVAVMAGCEVKATYDATCEDIAGVAAPTAGTVDVTADLPPQVGPNKPLTVRIDALGGDAGGTEPHTGGFIELSGVVEAGVYYVYEFPQTFIVTSLNQPGSTVDVRVLSGESFDEATGQGARCTVEGSTLLQSIPIVAPATTTTTSPPAEG